MKIAYIIMAHKNPVQLKRLTSALRYPGTTFHIHIDKKVNIAQFYSSLFPNPDNDLFFVHNREKIQWGKYSIVQSIINSLIEVTDNRFIARPDYIFLISGQDYPIVSNRHFHSFLKKNYGKEFIGSAAFPTSFWEPDGGYYRIRKYYFADIIKWRYIQKPIQFLMPSRKFPAGMHPYGGPMWWGLTYNCVKYVIRFISENPQYCHFFKNTAVMDEIFFHTIIMNSNFSESIFESLDGKELKDSIRFLRWCKKEPWHPEVLTDTDFDEIINSGKLFARKFDMDINHSILDKIDCHRNSTME